MGEYNIDDKLIDKVTNWLPQSDHANKGTTALRGVLSSRKPVEEQREEVKKFIYQNFITSEKYKGSRGTYNQVIIDNFSWEDKLYKMMDRGGLALEVFMVDYLNRYKYKYSGIQIEHTKGSPYLDHKRKVDYVSNIKQKNKRNMRVGVQLTTEQSGIRLFPNSYGKEMKKKRKIVKSLSDIIYQDEDLLDHETTPIDMTSYMIINGNINTVINHENRNIFLEAFQERYDKGLKGSGPIGYLPKRTRKDLGMIRYTYYLSLLDMTKFINKANKDKLLREEKNEDLYTHKNDAYIIRRSYLPEMKELSHNVFIGHNADKEKLLFSMSYFLNENIAPKDKI